MGVLIFHDYFINMLIYQYAGIIYQGNADLIFFTFGIYIISVFFGYGILPFFESPIIKITKSKFDVELINFCIDENINIEDDIINKNNKKNKKIININEEEIILKEEN
jgi:hypothetical protein